NRSAKPLGSRLSLIAQCKKRRVVLEPAATAVGRIEPCLAGAVVHVFEDQVLQVPNPSVSKLLQAFEDVEQMIVDEPASIDGWVRRDEQLARRSRQNRKRADLFS